MLLKCERKINGKIIHFYVNVIVEKCAWFLLVIYNLEVLNLVDVEIKELLENIGNYLYLKKLLKNVGNE